MPKESKESTKPAEGAKTEDKTVVATNAAQFDEDDDFEEFPVSEWRGKETEADADEEEVNAWEDNWDDEGETEDFSKQLRAELEKTGNVPMQTS